MLGELGRGSTSVVYRATHEPSHTEVALKTIDLSSIDDEDQPIYHERLRREVIALEQISHPNVIRLLDVGAEGTLVYLAMEFIEGASLERMQRAGLPLLKETVINVIADVASGLDYVHSRAIIHRDIKPSNILVRATGTAVVTDFGIAKIPRSRVGTKSGAIVGTIAYLTPEAIVERPLVYQSDQWALAVIAFELIAGQNPFAGATIEEMARRIMYGQSSSLSKLNSTVSSKTEAVIKKALSINPQERYPTCTAFASDLASALKWTPSWQPPPRVNNSVEPGSLTLLDNSNVPPEFISAIRKARPDGLLSSDKSVEYAGLRDSLRFYRDSLSEEFTNLSFQAKFTYKLWVGSVIFGLAMLGFGVVLMFLGKLTEGVMTAGTSVIVYFIQRVFQQREDYYRQAAAHKNANLEFGNHWLMIIQSIEAIPDENVRRRRQARLVDVLTHKLKSATLSGL